MGSSGAGNVVVRGGFVAVSSRGLVARLTTAVDPNAAYNKVGIDLLPSLMDIVSLVREYTPSKVDSTALIHLLEQASLTISSLRIAREFATFSVLDLSFLRRSLSRIGAVEYKDIGALASTYVRIVSLLDSSTKNAFVLFAQRVSLSTLQIVDRGEVPGISARDARKMSHFLSALAVELRSLQDSQPQSPEPRNF